MTFLLVDTSMAVMVISAASSGAKKRHKGELRNSAGEGVILQLIAIEAQRRQHSVDIRTEFYPCRAFVFITHTLIGPSLLTVAYRRRSSPSNEKL